MDDNVMTSASKEKKARSSRGRQRIEIKKIEDESKRQVTFSKRRKGLFKKAKELSTLCGVEVGILTLAKSGRVYTTDNIDAVLETQSSFGDGNDLLQKRNEVAEDINAEFGSDEPVEKLAQEKLMEYRVALMELREKAAVRLEELSIQDSSWLWGFVADEDVNEEVLVNQLMTEEGIYEWGL